jgi:hypothetical protein
MIQKRRLLKISSLSSQLAIASMPSNKDSIYLPPIMKRTFHSERGFLDMNDIKKVKKLRPLPEPESDAQPLHLNTLSLKNLFPGLNACQPVFQSDTVDFHFSKLSLEEKQSFDSEADEEDAFIQFSEPHFTVADIENGSEDDGEYLPPEDTEDDDSTKGSPLRKSLVTYEVRESLENMPLCIEDSVLEELMATTNSLKSQGKKKNQSITNGWGVHPELSKSRAQCKQEIVKAIRESNDKYIISDLLMNYSRPERPLRKRRLKMHQASPEDYVCFFCEYEQFYGGRLWGKPKSRKKKPIKA